MKGFFKEYFSFSKKERNGILVLASIILVSILVLKLIPSFYTHQIYNFENFDEEIRELEAEIIFVSDSDTTENGNFDFDPFYFDPNTVTDEDWEMMGLPNKVISIINNYKNKGGKFYSGEDVMKIYGFPNELYLKIKNYIRIKETKKKSYSDPVLNNKGNYDTVSYQAKNSDDIVMVDLNLSSKKEMLRIRELSYNIIDRIIKYRDLLGGFCKREQLMEVYGMDQKTYDIIIGKTTLSGEMIKMININNDDFKDMLKHPYLEYENVRMIVNYRKDYPISSMKDLLRNNLISEEQAQKLSAYIQFSSE